ncbi:MAG: hypothetical protein HQ478_07375 [Chloroflexi bacterium]|nr:hypothetical protein [Chloroflexota bacterium]
MMNLILRSPTVLIAYLLPVLLIALVACTSESDPSAPDMVRVDAPIERIEITKAAAKPPNASMTVVTGLRNGCESFDDYSLQRTGDLFSLTISNLSNEGPEMACNDDYRTVTTSIPLEGPIEECKRYVVEANGVAQDVVFTYTPFMESDARVCGS